MSLIPHSTRKKTTVVGVGDPLFGDRGVGILIAEALADHNLPPHVQVVDARSAGDSLDSLFANSDKVILIDTADAPGEPGTIYRITPVNPHDPAWASRLPYASTAGVFAAWEDALKSGASPSLTIIAVKPEAVRPAVGLSKKAASAVPKVVQAVMAEVASELGSDT